MIQKQKENKKRSKPKRASNIAKSIDEKQGKTEEKANEKPTTKLEHKQYYQECKRVMNKAWDSVSEKQIVLKKKRVLRCLLILRPIQYRI